MRLQREVYPGIPAWQCERGVQQIEIFPELSRKVCEMGANIIFVPSCTDDRQGFLRVRYCCHARAIENQVYIAVTGTVGNLPVEGLGLHYGQAAIITPSDFPFARDGIAAEGAPNMEQIVIADVDLGKLVMNRVSGTTIPLYDKRLISIAMTWRSSRPPGELLEACEPALPER
ncbi:MAG: nitrilase-related carbon-nitrogen hydrolase [Polaromonas sp.]